MNDPWDVKSVKHSGQYVSCMKINGVPLLPPVLSKECRKEMQYYKLLAKEVENRISFLKQYISNGDSLDVATSEVPDTTSIKKEEDNGNETTSFRDSQSQTLNDKVLTNMSQSTFDEDLNLANNVKNETLKSSPNSSLPQYKVPLDLPEKDCNRASESKANVILSNDNDITADTKVDNIKNAILDKQCYEDGPASLSSKSFTGSLNELHLESLKDSSNTSGLTRQRSYTVLHPSPQLIAHLEVQSLNTGIAMSAISMSDSVSNLNCKKRRSWDLETAKEKWSNMALELHNSKINKMCGNRSNTISYQFGGQPDQTPKRSLSPKATSQDRLKRNTSTPKSINHNENTTSSNKCVSPNRINKEQPQRKLSTPRKDHSLPNHKPISESDDPAARVRELYERIQKQQLMQMATLVEKQKKEQLLLQQVFEEQNNLLYKQLKTICPKSPTEVKNAWADKHPEANRGPVSLSQLISNKSPEQRCPQTPTPMILAETDNYISQCDNVLKRSKNITNSIKKRGGTSPASERCYERTINLEGSKTRTNSPVQKQKSTPTSRKLNYETSVSLDAEPPLTDRTNDTMADLNVTFPSDYSDECPPYIINKIDPQSVVNEVTVIHKNVSNMKDASNRSLVNSMASQDKVVISSRNSYRMGTPSHCLRSPTPQQRAAATTIVAYAKGYLVRRLMRTERVQGIVQTIRDALLCALQLHEERSGIRGADVELHRRLIQQITAACYSLHDAFVTSSAAERCAMIAADRNRKKTILSRQSPTSYRPSDI